MSHILQEARRRDITTLVAEGHRPLTHPNGLEMEEQDLRLRELGGKHILLMVLLGSCISPFLSTSNRFLEFLQITQAVSMGFFIMGVIGFVVKLIHIPINNILV